MNPRGVHIHQQSPEHLGKSQMEEARQGREGRGLGASLKPSQLKSFLRRTFSPGHSRSHATFSSKPRLSALYHLNCPLVVLCIHFCPSNSRLVNSRHGPYFILISPKQLLVLDTGQMFKEFSGLGTGPSFRRVALKIGVAFLHLGAAFTVYSLRAHSRR